MGFLIKGCSVNKDGSQKYAGSTATPSPTVSDNYNDRPEEIESFTVSEPTAAPVTPAPATPRPETPVYDEPVVENNSGVSIVVDEDDNAYGRLNTIVRKLYNGEYVSDEEFVYALNEINSLNYGDIPGLENLINGGRMSGRRTQVEFWKLFPSGSVDREVLRFFSEERNNVVNSAHDNNSQLRTRNEVNQLLDWCIAFIYNGEVVNINGNDYSFYDLSPIGRYILVDMAQEILTTNRMYVGNIDGVSCDFYTLINEFGEMYNVTTQNLENRSNIR